ncbi:methyltransferase family protein [Thermoguttaceae bacterium LCP21S3_D4]|jgi:protein-S-isoprenylcysteine O-methyltransferase Ste14|nr:isoprenylcysteine carboxylmethyltransferase family protein [Lachnospiraceae bacterium]MDD6304160.1 isoprenylcysteine carboxylmethyltransferase family protein [Lachnospiraceae bacterium]
MGFQITAVIILLAFYGCYFGKMLMQRKKGIKTDQIGKGKTGMVKRVELTMKAATLLVPAVEVISIIGNITALPLGIRGIGAGVAVVGDVVFILSVWTMKDSWRAGVSETDKTELVTNGIYKISRNPAFLGFDLVYVGILMMFFNWILLAVSLFAIIMFHLQIVNVEEDFLLISFGQEYVEYRKMVHRYLGRKRSR